MPVVVFKGIQGLCDRLQLLSHCIVYCQNTDTELCVDWEDHVWGGLEFDFYKVFFLEGVKTMKKHQVIRLLQNKKTKIRPSCWTPRQIIKHLTLEEMNPKYQGLFQKSTTEKVAGDILMTNGEGTRSWNCQVIAKHLRFQPEIIEEIKERLKHFQKESLVIHLRGTDRHISQLDLQSAILTFKEAPLKKYVVTDEKELWEEFKKEVPDAELVNPHPALFRLPKSPNGTHQHFPQLLKEYGITKREMLIDLLTDFSALIFSKAAGGRMESTFFQMARGIHTEGEELYKGMYGGWTPTN